MWIHFFLLEAKVLLGFLPKVAPEIKEPSKPTKHITNTNGPTNHKKIFFPTNTGFNKIYSPYRPTKKFKISSSLSPAFNLSRSRSLRSLAIIEFDSSILSFIQTRHLSSLDRFLD